MSKSSNGKNAQMEKKTYGLHFERYVQETAYAEVEAGSLAEAAEIARNMTWEEMDELEFDADVVVDDTVRLYSIASEDGNERISVSDVEKDPRKVLHIEACSLIDEPYVDKILHASHIDPVDGQSSDFRALITRCLRLNK